MSASFTFSRSLGGGELAVVSCTRLSATAMLLVTIHIPRERRGNKIGSALLKHLCELADENGVNLYAEPHPFDACPLTQDQLIEWYERHGFIRFGGAWRRWPVRRVTESEPGEHQEILDALKEC